ncbi:MAG: DUF1064 domain-containing protein [Pseudonocardiaceae bacterium]
MLSTERNGSMLRKRNKYNNAPTVADNIRFDSLAEARRYQELKLLMYAKVISHIRVHRLPAEKEAAQGRRRIA